MNHHFMRCVVTKILIDKASNAASDDFGLNPQERGDLAQGRCRAHGVAINGPWQPLHSQIIQAEQVKMKTGHKGFSLLEMLVVMAVMGILAMTAIPSYMHQIVRRQIIDAVPLAEIAKTPIAAAWVMAQSFPTDNAGAGLPAADLVVSNHIKSLSVQDGAIQITFGNSANGLIKDKLLTLRPAVVDEAPIVPVSWVCGYAAGPGKMTIKGENKTNIPAEYLPLNCRAP